MQGRGAAGFCDRRLYLPFIRLDCHDDPGNDHDDTDDSKDDQSLEKCAVAVRFNVHDIVSGLPERISHKFRDALVKVIVIHVKIAPENRFRLRVHDGISG